MASKPARRKVGGRRGTATSSRDLLYPVLFAGLIYGFLSDALTQIKDVLCSMLAVSVLMGWHRMRSRAIGGFPQRWEIIRLETIAANQAAALFNSYERRTDA